MLPADIIKRYRITDGHKFRLADINPGDTAGLDIDKNDAKELLEKGAKRLGDLQERLYAEHRWAILVILQGLDTAGKDGVIEHVMAGVNPQGCEVHPFKAPSHLELDHDFLWRANLVLPRRGHIGIFNRSYYEEVLVVRVHPEILRAQKVPHELLDDADIWEKRYRSIAEMEAHLHRNGTRILKFFLHVSKKEQAERFVARIDDPEKNWKFSSRDVEERKFWKDYMRAYEDCLAATSSKRAPWYVVPADDKANARLIVARIIVETLKQLDMAYPRPDSARRRELLALRRLLQK